MLELTLTAFAINALIVAYYVASFLLHLAGTEACEVITQAVGGCLAVFGLSGVVATCYVQVSRSEERV